MLCKVQLLQDEFRISVSKWYCCNIHMHIAGYQVLTLDNEHTKKYTL
jgi:hypothetical protein